VVVPAISVRQVRYSNFTGLGGSALLLSAPERPSYLTCSATPAAGKRLL